MSAGLEGVVVADTVMSAVDGQLGELLLRGFPVADLSGVVSFEQTCGLMLTGELPDDAESLRRALGEARVQAFEQIGELGDALEAPDGMDALRAAVARTSPRRGASRSP